MGFKFPFNWYNKFGTIPSEFREAMSYEEQILWLCKSYSELIEQFKVIQVEFKKVKEDYESVPEWVKNPENETELVDVITPDSDNSQIPTASAVYDLVQSVATGIPFLTGDTFNVYNLDNGYYKIDSLESGTLLYCGDKGVALDNDYESLLMIFGNHNFMLVSTASPNLACPLVSSGYCTSENEGTLSRQNTDILGFSTQIAINELADNIHVPSSLAVKTYVDNKIGDIETALNTINVGSGV